MAFVSHMSSKRSDEYSFFAVKVNCNITTEYNVPFGGYKQSGIGRELGAYAIDT